VKFSQECCSGIGANEEYNLKTPTKFENSTDKKANLLPCQRRKNTAKELK
jgi:hypothetical protein